MNSELAPLSYINRKASRRVIGALGTLLTLSAPGCDKDVKIADGTVFKKQHEEINVSIMPAGKGQSVPLSHSEIDTEAVGMPSSHQEYGLDRKTFNSTQLAKSRSDQWRVYIAQCPSDNVSTADQIEKECKTNSFSVSQEVFQNTNLKQHFNLQPNK